MKKTQEKLNRSVTYRLAGVITIGVTRIPVIGFGYPNTEILDAAEKQIFLDLMKSQTHARVDMDYLDPETDRISWSVFTADMHDPRFSIQMDLPVEARHAKIAVIYPLGERGKRLPRGRHA